MASIKKMVKALLGTGKMDAATASMLIEMDKELKRSKPASGPNWITLLEKFQEAGRWQEILQAAQSVAAQPPIADGKGNIKQGLPILRWPVSGDGPGYEADQATVQAYVVNNQQEIARALADAASIFYFFSELALLNKLGGSSYKKKHGHRNVLGLSNDGSLLTPLLLISSLQSTSTSGAAGLGVNLLTGSVSAVATFWNTSKLPFTTGN